MSILHGELPFCKIAGLVLLCGFAAVLQAFAQTDMAYPSDAKVLNVKTYGATGNGTTDDTVAFQTAITAALQAAGGADQFDDNAILYVPNGTYLIKNTLVGSISGAFDYGMHIQGQSQAGTILKLQNSCTGFTVGTTQKPVIQTGSQGGHNNTAFHHYIKNLTIDVGTGNPGAVGVDFMVNNRGGLFNVTIKSEDYQGSVGVQMDRTYPGPGLLKNVTIVGFATGITMLDHGEYGMTFDNINLSHQTANGISTVNTMTIANLTSSNTVPVINSSGGHVTVIGGTFTGGSPSNNAITGTGSVYARDITCSGYANVFKVTAGATIAGNGATPVTVSEYESRPQNAAPAPALPLITKGTGTNFATNINGSIRLPIEETPDLNDTTMTDWINGATAATVTGTGTSADYAASIQAAIDTAGKKVVYLPQGRYQVSKTIHLEGSIQKFLGCNARLAKLGTWTGPLIEFDGGTAAYTDIQGIYIAGDVLHNSTKDLVLENLDLVGNYSNTSSGTGALFLEDETDVTVNVAFPQYVWARQLDIESVTSTFVTNHGGVFWILGYKTEADATTTGTIFDNENGGWAEILGGFTYVLDVSGTAVPTAPMLINNQSHMSANFKLDPANGIHYSNDIKETESGVTELINADSEDCTLYSGSAYTFGTIDDTNTALITYSPGAWAANTGQTGYFDLTDHASLTPQSTALFSFTGSSIEWIGGTNNDHGYASVFIDGVLAATVDTYSSTWLKQQVLYSQTWPSSGSHSIKIIVRTTRDAASTNCYQDVDAFIYQP